MEFILGCMGIALKGMLGGFFLFIAFILACLAIGLIIAGVSYVMTNTKYKKVNVKREDNQETFDVEFEVVKNEEENSEDKTLH
jgi:hypothetical protein